MRLNRRFRRADEAQAEKRVIDVAVAIDLVFARRALEQLAEIRVHEQLTRAGRIEIAIRHPIEQRDAVLFEVLVDQPLLERDAQFPPCPLWRHVLARYRKKATLHSAKRLDHPSKPAAFGTPIAAATQANYTPGC